LLTAIAGFALAATVTSSPAVEVFDGFTDDGCFAAACVPPTSVPPQTASLPGSGLTYLNSSFSVTTAGGFVGIGSPPANPNIDNLGSFTLTGTPFIYNGDPFDLRVTFTAPPGTSPDTAIIAAVITGAVTRRPSGRGSPQLTVSFIASKPSCFPTFANSSLRSRSRITCST
jgi:hypothetical protein